MEGTVNDRLALFLVVTIGSGWFLAEIILPAAIKGYTPPAGINEALGIVTGIIIAGIGIRWKNGSTRRRK
jgi:uncharacterized membrane protein